MVGMAKNLKDKIAEKNTRFSTKQNRLIFCLAFNFSNNSNLFFFSKLPPIIFEMREIKPQTV